MKILAIVENLPHNQDPYCWVAVNEQICELSRYCNIKIMVTPMHAYRLLTPWKNKQDAHKIENFGYK